jgi:hypothetical protein
MSELNLMCATPFLALEMHAWESVYVAPGMHEWHMKKCLHVDLDEKVFACRS